MKSRNNDFSERVIVMIINIANHGLKSIIINRKESAQYTVQSILQRDSSLVTRDSHDCTQLR